MSPQMGEGCQSWTSQRFVNYIIYICKHISLLKKYEMSPFWWVLVFYITCLTKNFQQILTQLNKLVFLCMSNSKKNFSLGPWTKEEDEKVIELVKKHGPKRWTLIARQLKVIRGTVNRFIIISFTGINVNKSSAWINIWINYSWNNLWKALSTHQWLVYEKILTCLGSNRKAVSWALAQPPQPRDQEDSLDRGGGELVDALKSDKWHRVSVIFN